MARYLETVCKPSCPGTTVEELPANPLNEGHVAVRFIINGQWHYLTDYYYFITLDGHPISPKHCDEVCPGEDGYVVVYTDGACLKGSEHFKQRLNGKVSLRMLVR